MSISQYSPRAEYIGNGSLAEYTFDFKVTANTQLLIQVTSASFVETFRVRGDDVTYLSDVTLDPVSGGTITLASVLPTGHFLTILQANDEPIQASEFKNKNDFTTRRFEDALDYQMSAIQRLQYLAARSLKISDNLSDNETFDPTVPVSTIDDGIENNVDKMLVIGADNASIAFGPSAADIISDTADAAQIAVDAAIAAHEAAIDPHTQYHNDARGDARYFTQAQIAAGLATKEDVIAAGITTQYWRGDKTWQVLDKAAVGLSNVDNTSDLSKPISTLTQTALDGKSDQGHTHPLSDLTQSGASANQVPKWNGSAWVPATLSDNDKYVAVSSGDTTPGYLVDKFTIDHGSNTSSPLELSTTDPGFYEVRNLRFDSSKISHTDIADIGTLTHDQLETEIDNLQTAIDDLDNQTALTFVFSGANSDVAGYKSMPSLPSYAPSALATNVLAATTTPAIIEEFATNLGFPNITKIPAGTVYFHYETTKDAGPHTYYSYAELYKRSSGGAETLLLTSDNSSQSALNTTQQITVSALNIADITILATDRLVVKIYAVMVSNTANITLGWDDNTDARLQLPYVPVDATNFVPYVGSTADIDLGNTYKVKNAIDPTAAQDVSTKAYVDKSTASKTPLSITIGGAWLYEYLFWLATPRNTERSGVVTEYNGKWIESFSYTESSAPYSPRLTSIAFNDLVGCRASFVFTSCVGLTSISLPTLKAVVGALSFPSASALTSFSAPNLVELGSFAFTGSSVSSLDLSSLVNCSGAFSPSTFTGITTLSLPSLVTVGGNFSPSTHAALTSLSAPILKDVGGAFSPSTLNALTSMSFPSLERVQSFAPSTMTSITSMSFPVLEQTIGAFTLSNFTSLNTINFNSLTKTGQFTVSAIAVAAISFPALTTVGSSFTVTGSIANTSVSFPALTSVVSLSMTSGSAITSVNLSALTTCTGAFTFSYAGTTSLSLPALTNISGAVNHTGANGLTSISYPAMITYGSTFTAGNLTNLVTATLGTIGTLKSIAGSSVSFTVCALNQASVDGILALLVSLDGTGGTTLFGAGKTVTLNGGTNSTPSAAGLINKATLQARGATVNTN